MQLGLVCPPDSTHHTYRSTTDGDKLADAFGSNIPEEKAKLFWESIYNGSISQMGFCYFVKSLFIALAYYTLS